MRAQEKQRKASTRTRGTLFRTTEQSSQNKLDNCSDMFLLLQLSKDEVPDFLGGEHASTSDVYMKRGRTSSDVERMAALI